MSRLQFRHSENVFNSREEALSYINSLIYGKVGKQPLLDKSLIGEPFTVVYLDENSKKQTILCIGNKGEKSENVLEPYHIIDSAKLSEDIEDMSGSTEELRHLIEELQNELNTTQEGAGLNEDGTYSPNTESNYISGATSLKDADTKLDKELNRVETARKNITGQHTDEYVPNQNLVTRPIAYISGATDMNDADVKLDEALQEHSKNTIKHVVVDGVDSIDENNVATINISGNSIPIGEYENYEGKASKPHPIHNDYSLLDAVKQLDLNFVDFVEKEESERKGIHIVKVTTGLDTNVREAYDLVDKNGYVMKNSERVLIYKDSSLINVYLGHTDDRLEDYTQPIVTPGTGDTALCFIYFKADGYYQLVCINVEAFLEESEFLDGLSVDNHKVKVLIDTNSEEYLTVSRNGVKLSGIDSAIDVARQDEEDRAVSVETALQEELDTTQTGAGLNEDGTYKRHNTQGESNYIHEATSLDGADIILDRELKRVEDKVDAEIARASAVEDSISGDVTTLARATKEEFRTTNEKIVNETSRATAAENTLQAELDRTQTGSGLNEDGTYKKHNTSPDDLANYIYDATSLSNADFILDRTINQLSGSVGELSAATETAIKATKVKSDDRTILVTPSEIGTNLSVNIDRVTIAKDDNGVLSTKLSIKKLATPSSTNVREEYALVDNNGNNIGDTVKVYKDSSLQSVELVTIDNKEYLRFTYILVDGSTKVIDLDVSSFLSESEFKDGLKVEESKVYVLIDPNSEEYLTVSSRGIKLSGINNAINNAVNTEKERAMAAENGIDQKIQDEILARQNADTTLDGKIATETTRATGKESELQTAISNEVTRATNVESDLQTQITNEKSDRQAAITDVISQYTNAITEESTSRIDSDERLERMLTGYTSTTDQKISELTEKVNNEITRATESENSISGNVRTLSGSVVTFSSSTVSELTTIKENIESLNAKTVVGDKAVNVNTAGNTSTVSLVINGSDNVLSQDASGLKTTLSIDLSADGKTLSLKGKNCAVISTIDTTSFVKDGMLDNVTFDTTTKTLKFVFNTDSGKTQIDVPLGSLVDTYTVSANSTNYLVIDNYKVGAKVDVDGGLASKNSVDTLRNDTITSANTIINTINQLSGSVREINTNLTNNVNNLSASTKTIETNTNTNTTNISQLSGSTKTIETNTNKNTTDISQLSASTVNIKNDVNELSGSVVTFSSTTENRYNLTVTSAQTLNTKIEGETTRATNIENELRTLINNVNAKTVVGDKAVNVNTVGNTSTVSLVINSSDNVLSQDATGLKTTLTFDLSADGKTLSLKGKNGATITTLDTSKFIKDGMLNNVEVVGTNLQFTFNTDSGKDIINVPLSSLADIYTVSGGSTSYLVIDNYKLAANVDVDGGLASYLALTNEVNARTNADVQINTKIDNLSASTVNIKTDVTNLSASTKNIETKLNELSGSTIIIEGNVDNNTNKINQLSSSTQTIENKVSTNTTNINQLSASTRIIENNLNSLSGSVVTLSSSTVNEINNIKNSISDLTAQTISGDKAITVTKSESDSKVGLILNSSNKILSQDGSGLNAVISIATSSDTSNNEYIVLKGINGETISSVNVNSFVKDGMLQNVELIGTTLRFTFNTASGKNTIDVPLASLADTYTVSANSTSYLVIDNYKVGAKVDVDGGLASYGKLFALSGSVVTLSGTVVSNKNEINTLKEKVQTLETKVQTLETKVQTLENTINNIDTIIEEKVGENIYNSIINILQGTANEISVTGDSATNKITISFANPYTVGEHDNDTSTDY